MPVYERSDLEIRHHDAGTARAQELIAAFIAEVSSRLSDGFDPERSVSATEEELSPPDGDFLVIESLKGDDLLGCGGLKRLSPTRIEIKRMWISPDARGMGLGRDLLAALEQRATELGANEVVLDTNAELLEAAALYRSAGYEEIPPCNDNPYASLWLRKFLSGGLDVDSGE